MYLFFFSSSSITRIGEGIKKILEGKDFKKGGGRNYIQVFSNGGWQTIIACLYIYFFRSHFFFKRKNNVVGDRGEDQKEQQMVIDERNSSISLKTYLQCFSLAAYACCCGDTWASELGILSQSNPRLIIMPWKVVP